MVKIFLSWSKETKNFRSKDYATSQQIKEDKRILSSQIERVQSKFAAGFMLSSDSILELAKSAKSLWNRRDKEKRVDLLKMVLSNQQLNGKVVESSLHKPFKILGEIRDLEELAKKKLLKKEAFKKWCPGEDLNLHACALDPKSSVYTNFTTWATW